MLGNRREGDLINAESRDAPPEIDRPAAPATPAPAEGGSELPESGGMFHSLKVYEHFRMLIFGTLATNTAFWMYQVAVGWLALELTDSAAFVGLAGFVAGIPILLFSIPAGIVIDRYDKKLVLQIAQSGIMLVAALFAFFVYFDFINRGWILVLSFLYGSIMSFIFPTRTSIVPTLVERKDLANGIALNSAGQNATRVIGPSLAGVLIAIIGIAGTFAIAAAMQIFALLATYRLPTDKPRAAEARKGGWAALTLGLRIVAKDQYLTGLVVGALIPTLFVMPYLNLMPVITRDERGLGSGGLGLLLTAVGLGTVAGSLAVAQSDRLRTLPGSQVYCGVVFALSVIIFALVDVLAVSLVMLFVSGAMSAGFLAINQTSMQLHVDHEVRGRVISIYLMTWGMLPFGQLAVGALASEIGASPAIAISAMLGIVVLLLVARRYAVLRE
jgi:MFS family permease